MSYLNFIERLFNQVCPNVCPFKYFLVWPSICYTKLLDLQGHTWLSLYLYVLFSFCSVLKNLSIFCPSVWVLLWIRQIRLFTENEYLTNSSKMLIFTLYFMVSTISLTLKKSIVSRNKYKFDYLTSAVYGNGRKTIFSVNYWENIFRLFLRMMSTNSMFGVDQF